MCKPLQALPAETKEPWSQKVKSTLNKGYPIIIADNFLFFIPTISPKITYKLLMGDPLVWFDINDHTLCHGKMQNIRLISSSIGADGINLARSFRCIYVTLVPADSSKVVTTNRGARELKLKTLRKSFAAIGKPVISSWFTSRSIPSIVCRCPNRFHYGRKGCFSQC